MWLGHSPNSFHSTRLPTLSIHHGMETDFSSGVMTVDGPPMSYLTHPLALILRDEFSSLEPDGHCEAADALQSVSTLRGVGVDDEYGMFFGPSGNLKSPFYSGIEKKFVHFTKRIITSSIKGASLQF
ncbi:hypothetical protein IRJ41_012063 [Triplophysa rosa]|uniref:Uncharacterized protein n=1 Tax=Triplophysa rosa TaxID=992332 RepID=A0A9W7TJ68_TRIRA|nr:hypothetical protein IRJ41_012063 [Triplophysa rosa]